MDLPPNPYDLAEDNSPDEPEAPGKMRVICHVINDFESAQLVPVVVDLATINTRNKTPDELALEILTQAMVQVIALGYSEPDTLTEFDLIEAHGQPGQKLFDDLWNVLAAFYGT
jgi:hypothetical protein